MSNPHLQQQQQMLNPKDASVDIHGPSTSGHLGIEPGSFSLFSHNKLQLDFSSEVQTTKYLSSTYGGKQALNALLEKNLPRTDVETGVVQGSNGLLAQNLPRTSAGTGHEESENLSGTYAVASNVETVTYSQFLINKKSMAEGKKQPIFKKIEELRAGGEGLNLLVKVVAIINTVTRKVKKIKQKVKKIKQKFSAECLVGDETGTIVFIARKDQIDLMKEGDTLKLCNAKIEIFKESMRLAVDKWGSIEVTDPATFSVKEDINLSLRV